MSFLTADNSIVVIVDIQERLAPVIDGIESVIASVEKLGAGARQFQVPAIITEQYPQGLGPSISSLQKAFPDAVRVEKMHFGAMPEQGFRSALNRQKRSEILLCGTEAHVCVLQTAFGVKGAGYRTLLVEDACGSRRESDHRRAMARAEQAGIEIVTTEMVLFEWMRCAGTADFRELIKVIK